VWSSAWVCPAHGAVPPLLPVPQPSAEWAHHVVRQATGPVLLPWPLPWGWVVSAVFAVGEPVTGIRGSAVALSGPNPLGGPADLLVVVEEPGVGMGARFAGIPGPDPGDRLGAVPDLKLGVAGRLAPLWCLRDARDQAAYVGETEGRWLWIVLRPESAGHLLLEDLLLADLRELGAEADLIPFGALPPWLAVPGPEPR
jgi:hypothetical protein